MSKSHAKRRKPESKTPARSPNKATYLVLLMIGLFVVLLAVPLTGGVYWRHTGWGYLALMTILINLYTFRAYLGSKLAPWQKALAALPLRCVGYGTRGGKPVEAAHGQPDAKKMIVGSLLASVVLLGAIGAVVFVGPWS